MSENLTGQTIGKYRIERRLGDGAYADVYHAFDSTNQRHVAIKIPKSDLDEYPDLAERFMREINAFDLAKHPNIVEIYDAGKVDGFHFIAMEFVDGRDLATLQRKINKFSLEASLDIVRQVAAGLFEAHRHNIIHRDIKPGNILLDNRGTAKITDFGVAKIANPDFTKITKTGHHLGTIAFMSPEQIKGIPVDGRSDIFSLGSVLFRLISGKSPFFGTEEEILKAICESEPRDLRQFALETPDSVLEILDKAMQKEPARRFQTAKEIEVSVSGVLSQLNASEWPAAGLVESAMPRPVPLPVPFDPDADTAPFVGFRNQPSSQQGLLVSTPGPDFNIDQESDEADEGRLADYRRGINQAAPRQQDAPRFLSPLWWLLLPLAPVIGGYAGYVHYQWQQKPVQRSEIHVGKTEFHIGNNGNNDYSSINEAIAASPKPRTEFYVEKTGIYDYSSINDAIAAVPAGSTVFIQRGSYNEVVRLNKKITLVGLGNRNEIRIEPTSGNGVWMDTDYAEVRNLTIHCRAPEADIENGIFIPWGKLVVQDCVVRSDSASGIQIGVPDETRPANPVIRNCVIRDGKTAGVHVYENGKGTIEDCEIYGNGLSGVDIKEGGDPVVRNCVIRDGKSAGVHVWQNGKGTIEDCEIYGNGLSGVEIKEGGDPVVKGCTITKNKEYGVASWATGKGRVENCDLRGNTAGPKWQGAGSTTKIINCKTE